MPDPSPKPQTPSAAKPTGKPTVKPAGKPAPGVDPVLDRLVAESPMASAKGCPSCATPLTAAAKICTGCGFDLESGKPVKTRVMRAAPAKKSGGPTEAPRWLAPAAAALIVVGLAVAYFTGALDGLLGESQPGEVPAGAPQWNVPGQGPK